MRQLDKCFLENLKNVDSIKSKTLCLTYIPPLSDQPDLISSWQNPHLVDPSIGSHLTSSLHSQTLLTQLLHGSYHPLSSSLSLNLSQKALSDLFLFQLDQVLPHPQADNNSE